MSETIAIGSAAGTWSAVLFFAALCATLGYVVFALLARPETRRAEFLRCGALPRGASLLLALVAGGGLFLLICWFMFSGFDRIEVAGERFLLHYSLPPRTVEIPRDRLTLLEKKYAYKISWRLAVTTSDRQSYESQPAGEAAIEAARLRLAQFAAE